MKTEIVSQSNQQQNITQDTGFQPIVTNTAIGDFKEMMFIQEPHDRLKMIGNLTPEQGVAAMGVYGANTIGILDDDCKKVCDDFVALTVSVGARGRDDGVNITRNSMQQEQNQQLSIMDKITGMFKGGQK